MSEKSSPTKRQRWSPGAVVSVPLGNGFHAYGQMLDDPEYAFFDLRTADDLSADAVVAHPVAFRLWVMRYAHSSGRWAKIGKAPIAAPLREPFLRFSQDPLRPETIRLTFDGIHGRPVSIDECEDLERATIWDPDHVEDRLRDHFEGVPNAWSLSLRPKRID